MSETFHCSFLAFRAFLSPLRELLLNSCEAVLKDQLANMKAEVLDQLASFSLSQIEGTGVELVTKDVNIGLEEGNKSLLGRVFGEKKANLVGVKSSLMKIWQHRGLRKVVGLEPNTFQFIFEKETDKDGILRSRPWFFDNQLLVVHPWMTQLTWNDDCFKTSPLWIQVWNVPFHWLSIDTGKKIGSLLGNPLNVLISDGGSKAGRHFKILVDLDLTKPLARGTKLKYQQNEIWVQFKYEQLPTFCYYCGCIGHSERVCAQRLKDLEENCLKKDQFGPWMRASTGKGMDGGGFRRSMPVGKPAGGESDKVVSQAGSTQVLNPQSRAAGVIALPSVDLASSEPVWKGDAADSKLPDNQQQASPTVMDSDSHGTSLIPPAEPVVLDDNMLEDIPQPSVPQPERGIKHLVDTEQYALTVGHELLRIPLQDCTNTTQLLPGERKGDIHPNTKGHWKRKARLQGTKAAAIESTSDSRLEQIRKRDRREVDPTGTVEPGSPAGKRGRVIQQQDIHHTSEVGATSHEWSQGIR